MGFGPKEAYLTLYNFACALGWAYVLYLGTTVLLADGIPCCHHEVYAGLAQVYNNPPYLKETLIIVQCAALLEIVHSAIGLVRSPVVVTGEETYAPLIRRTTGYSLLTPKSFFPSPSHAGHVSYCRTLRCGIFSHR